MEAVTISDFSGGVTDKYVDCAANSYQYADNLLITSDKKFRTRPGSKLFDTDNLQLPTGKQRSNGIFIDSDKNIFFGSGYQLYAYDITNGYVELLGPSGNAIIPRGDVYGYLSVGFWNKMGIIALEDPTNNYINIPSKFFKDQNGIWQTRTVGLPTMSGVAIAVVTAGTTNFYNYKICWFTKYYVETLLFEDWGSFQQLQISIDSADLTSNAVTLSSIPTIVNGTVSPKLNYATGNSETGIDEKDVTITSANPGVVSFTAHGMETGEAVYFKTTGSLPTNLTANTPYYIIYVSADSFSVATTYKNALAGTAIDTTSGAQSGIHTCYQIKIYAKIFRSQLNGSDFTYLDTIANGVTSYTDSAADTDIINNEKPYTDGGVLNNDPPPPCKYVHIANGIAWYGYVTEGNELKFNRIMQSIKNDPDSVPMTSYIDLEDTVKGISSYLDRVIVLCESPIYRLDGYLDEIGGGSLTYQRLHGSAGCLSNNSIVQIPTGIVWAGKEGIYYTDGFNVMCISQDMTDSYKKLTQTEHQKRRIFGAYDALNNRVHWSFQSETGALDDCNVQWVLDLSYGIRPQSTFTTASGKNNFAPTAFAFNDDGMIRGDSRGYVFQHRDDYLSDPTIDDTVLATEWGSSAIIYNYVSGASSLGSLQYRKFTPRIVIDTFNESNLSVQLISNNDLGRVRSELRPIRYRGSMYWSDPLLYWGNSELQWNNNKLIEEQRRINSNSLRCSYKQIEVTNAKVNIVNSDELGNATASLLELTIDSATFVWPLDCIGHFISFESDEYTKEYIITKRTDKTLTLLDSYQKSVTITEALPGVVTLIDHGHSTGDEVSFITDGVMPTNIISGQTYYVIKVTDDTYKLAATLSDAQKDFPIDTTGSSAIGNIWERSFNNGSQKFVMRGYPKNEILNLMSLTLHYKLLGNTQKMYTGSEAGNNE